MNSQKEKFDLPAHCYEEISNLLEQDFLEALNQGNLDQIQVVPEHVGNNPCSHYLE